MTRKRSGNPTAPESMTLTSNMTRKGQKNSVMTKGAIIMANKQEDHLVQCPYYKTNTSQVIYCEGLEDGMAIHLAFATHAQLIDYKGRFCRRLCYSQCPLAKILNQKWGYE